MSQGARAGVGDCRCAGLGGVQGRAGAGAWVGLGGVQAVRIRGVGGCTEKQVNLELILLTTGGLEPKRSTDRLLLSRAPKNS